MARQAISLNAVFVGLCALIPVPFLDDLLRRAMMRGAYQAIAHAQRQPLPEEALEQLTRPPPLRVLGCLGFLFWYPIKKISRKIFYFFTIKDAIDWAAEAAIRGEMVRMALVEGALPERGPQVRAAMDLAWSQAGGSPLTRSLLFRPHEPLDWRPEEGAAVAVVGRLAERGAAVAVLRRFLEELRRPDPPKLPAPDVNGPGVSAGAAEGTGAENGS